MLLPRVCVWLLPLELGMMEVDGTLAIEGRLHSIREDKWEVCVTFTEILQKQEAELHKRSRMLPRALN